VSKTTGGRDTYMRIA